MKVAYIYVFFIFSATENKVLGNPTAEEVNNVNAVGDVEIENPKSGLDGGDLDDEKTLIHSNTSISETVFKETEEGSNKELAPKVDSSGVTSTANKNCPGISCSPPPTQDDVKCQATEDSTMNAMSFAPFLRGVAECCPFWVCTSSDGSIFTHFGITSRYETSPPRPPAPIHLISTSGRDQNRNLNSGTNSRKHQPPPFYAPVAVRTYGAAVQYPSSASLNGHIQPYPYYYSYPYPSLRNQGTSGSKIPHSSNGIVYSPFTPVPVHSAPTTMLTLQTPQDYNPAWNLFRERRDATQMPLTGSFGNNFRQGSYNMYG